MTGESHVVESLRTSSAATFPPHPRVSGHSLSLTTTTMKLLPFVRTRRRLLSCLFVLSFCLSCDATATDSFILLSDGSHLKVHSRSSASISSSLGYRTDDRSSRITGLDYRGSTGRFVPITWIESRRLMTGTVDLVTKNLSRWMHHPIPFPVTHLAVDRSSCMRHVLLVPEDGTGIWKYETQTKDLKPLITNVTGVSRVFAANGDVFWMQEENCCLYKREIMCHPKTGDVKETVACFDTGVSIASAYVQSSGRVVYLLSSDGDVYRASVGDRDSLRLIFPASQFKDRKFLKYEVNQFDAISVFREEDGSVLRIFVSIKNHGILVEITMSCLRTSPESSTVCSLNNIRDEVSENKLYDFKLLSDPGINCSDDVNTIRTQVLMDRLRNANFGRYSDGTGSVLMSWAVVYAVLSLMFLILVCKLVFDLYNKKRGDSGRGTLTDLLKGRDDRRQILRRSPSTASLSHSNSHHALHFPPMTLSQSPAQANQDSCLVKAVSIEDLTGFSNPSFDVVPRRVRTASQKSCGSCDYKQECKELGVCLTTYSLLHQ